ncbi:histidine triad (HIT) family protein [Cryobacterium mesophilum]|uniref:Histidine triad nucleotide-binding protein n=1 Tax=Terrimesophilobacter mesophilus TaxID=433647 RepID=A0A4R8VB85_9MICO|nr:histidine triad nucleotide-binding protein [Terrimesophilobacter mesophilus]MBB5632256.1 histidine triad (HIT) family protein [Terrimesophilobacter mesophilus]TFB79107.1 histidine triad nucleotide-binding protein [Terrimesophilobacter mesophilus]
MPDSAEPSIFTRIVAREIPADIVFENDTIIAFRDINPQAPVHLLVVPKTEEYRNVSELAEGDPALLAEIVATAKRLADEHCGGDFRLIFNEGETTGQTVFHVHAHVLGATQGDTLAEESLGQ